jgi:predicted  nucleic acid-binding Zn-ribbon protein
MSEIPAESLQATLARANELSRTLQPLGASLGILELKPTFETMKAAVEAMARQLVAVDAELKAKREYGAALEIDIANKEQRAQELAEHLTPEERQLQGRLAEIEGQIAHADEIRRTAESASQKGVEEVARWLRSVRGG